MGGIQDKLISLDLEKLKEIQMHDTGYYFKYCIFIFVSMDNCLKGYVRIMSLYNVVCFYWLIFRGNIQNWTVNYKASF